MLRSTSGKPEGPYENIPGNEAGPIFGKIDGSLFEDHDGSVYFVGHNHYYAKMMRDMSAFDGELKQFIETPYPNEPYIEGAFLFRHADKYHLVGAIWSFKMPDGSFSYDASAEKAGGIRWTYDCVVASSDRLEGPYGERYTVGVGIGHNNLFQDNRGQWWATHFGNPRGSDEFKQPFLCRPAIVPLRLDGDRFQIKQD